MKPPPPMPVQTNDENAQPHPPTNAQSSNHNQSTSSTSSALSDDPFNTARRVDRPEVASSSHTLILANTQKTQAQTSDEIDKLTAMVHDKLTEVFDFCKKMKEVMVKLSEQAAAEGPEVVKLKHETLAINSMVGVTDEKRSGDIAALREDIYKVKWEIGNRDEKLARLETEVQERRGKMNIGAVENEEERKRRLELLERLRSA